MRKFFFHCGIKVDPCYTKFTELNFSKISCNTYLDPVSSGKKFKKFLTHATCEKLDTLKKCPKNTTFLHFAIFQKMHVLNFCETLQNKTPSLVRYVHRFLGKMLVLNEKCKKMHRNFTDSSQYHREHFQKIAKFCAGGQRNFASICENSFFIMGQSWPI